MIVLALESAALVGGVAILQDDKVVAESVLDISVTYSEKLLPAVAAICKQNKILLKEFGLIAADIGPGSFTGLRIGIATAEGLGQALGIPLVGVISLEAMAVGADGVTEGLVSPCLDARRGEIYTALYEKSSAGLKMIEPPQAVDPESWRRQMKRHGKNVKIIGPDVFPRPGIIGRLGIKNYLANQSGTAELNPLYLRRPV